MDLNTVRAVRTPARLDEIPDWPSGHAWLAGGTWLMSEPQLSVDTLVDLHGLGWEDIAVNGEGVEIGATCPISKVAHFVGPVEWPAAHLFKDCAHSLLMSFKVAGVATVGGNICMSLPAGAMISLAVALEATYMLWQRDGSQRTVYSGGFVTGNHANILAPGELLRSIHIPASALARHYAIRRASLTHLGRSAGLLIGTSGPNRDLLLTITAATPRPIQLRFGALPGADEVRAAIDAAIPADGYFDDVNGTPAYKRHITYHFAEEIRAELSAVESKS